MAASRLASSASLLPLARLANKVPEDPQERVRGPGAPRLLPAQLSHGRQGLQSPEGHRAPRPGSQGSHVHFQPQEGLRGLSCSQHISQKQARKALHGLGDRAKGWAQM